MYKKIRYEVSEHIATIRFDRAEKLNAYTPEMGEEIVAAFSARSRRLCGSRSWVALSA